MDRCLDLLAEFSRALIEREEQEEEEKEEDKNNNDGNPCKLKHGNHLTECLSQCAGTVIPSTCDFNFNFNFNFNFKTFSNYEVLFLLL